MDVRVGEQTVQVQLPKVDTQQARSTVRIPSGSHVLLQQGEGHWDGGLVRRFVLVSARAVELHKELKPGPAPR